MEWFLLLLVVVVSTPVLVLSVGALVAARSMQRANMVLPGRGQAPPPLRWLWSPGAAASLHRRLRSACRLVAPLAGPALPRGRPLRRKARQQPVDGLAQLARDVLREAVLLDSQVLTASHLAAQPRSQALMALDHQVMGLEDAARRVHLLAARRAQLARVGGPPILNLDQRIAAMEHALGELAPPPTSWPSAG